MGTKTGELDREDTARATGDDIEGDGSGIYPFECSTMPTYLGGGLEVQAGN